MKLLARLAVSLLLLNLFIMVPPSRAENSGQIYFAQTGKFIEGQFMTYWQTHGGLAIFGYPITPQFYENGFLVQYFERNRFELHPENAGTPYEVLLGLLGKDRWQATYPDTAPPPPALPVPPDAITFPQTGHSLGGTFLNYWQTHGGLAQFGYPISSEITEAGLTVQYFERARFELHPENAGTPYEVLLGLLGYDRGDLLDASLRDAWSANPPFVTLQIQGASGSVAPLTPLTVVSNASGELRLLGGDNRLAARYNLSANQPLTIRASGMAGAASWLLYQNGQVVAAQWNAFQIAPPVIGIQSGDPVLDGLYPRVKGFLQQDAVTYDSPLTHLPVLGYRSPDTPFIWLRDHVYQSKGFKFFEPQMKSTLDYFRQAQHDDGSFDDYFEYYNGYDVYKGQIGVEADQEYLFVQGVWTAWQATGDDTWLRENLDAMERGLNYTFTSPQRWSSELGLVKRAFTIDTWDFEQGSDTGTIRRQLDSKTEWSIMHGDNTGTYQAARWLAQIERYLGRPEQATMWDHRADSLRTNLNQLAWNGHFYTHQIHLTPVAPTGVDEKTQLSLSNAYALNRGTLDQSQAAALIETYQAREAQNKGKSFAEWYSIDPPFPTGFGKPGDYVNGGIMPLVGGELARGAFQDGFEAYGLDILRRYWQLLDQSGGSYLWYHPNGTPGIGTAATLPTDGWGASAMLNALTEGLAGVVDNGKLYQDVTLSPRWAATDRPSAQVTLGYAASGAYFTYQWQHTTGQPLTLAWAGGQTRTVQLHLMLPADLATPHTLLINGIPTAFTISTVQNSLYLDASLPGNGSLSLN